MRFTALVISTTQPAVTSGARSGDNTTTPVWNKLNGIRKKNIETPNQNEHARGEHLAGELRGRRHLDEIVERAGDEHHARAEQQADRLGVVDEHLAELVHLRRDRHRREEAHEHRRAAQRRRRLRVHVTSVR